MKVIALSLALVMLIAMVSADLDALQSAIQRHHRRHHHHHHRHHSEGRIRAHSRSHSRAHGHGHGHEQGGHGKSHDAHHWGYEQNGADWGGLCQTGRRQSPVRVVTSQTKDAGTNAELRLGFNYNTVRKAEIFNNGHVLQVESRGRTPFGSVTYKGAEYEVLQFHFHAPAEHVIDDKQYPIEMHIVHRKKGAVGLTELLVVGVFFDDQVKGGKASDFLDSLKWDNLPRKNHKKRRLRSEDGVDLNLLEALQGDVYNYAGSLTTPTCDETVAWNVMTTVESASTEQVKAIQAVFAGRLKFAKGKGNNRAIQSLNGRDIVVVHSAPAGTGITDDFGFDF